jgi:DNA-binding NarL/FixJ family response regulator
MTTRILLIGQGLFRDGLEHVLAQEPSVTIVGSVSTWTEAQDLMARVRADALIVDHASEKLRQADLLPLLGTEAQDIKVIHLTLAENRMVVHDQRQVTDVSLADLLGVLHSSAGSARDRQEPEPC